MKASSNSLARENNDCANQTMALNTINVVQFCNIRRFKHVKQENSSDQRKKKQLFAPRILGYEATKCHSFADFTRNQGTLFRTL